MMDVCHVSCVCFLSRSSRERHQSVSHLDTCSAFQELRRWGVDVVSFLGKVDVEGFRLTDAYVISFVLIRE